MEAHILQRKQGLASAYTLDPDLVGYIWNGADAARSGFLTSKT